MTPEHKALVEALTRKAEADGLLSVEDIRAVTESLAQGAQPQAGEVVEKPYAYEFGRSNGDDTYSVFIERSLPAKPHPDWPVKPLYASPQPANPAQVTDASEDRRQFKNFHRLLCERFGYTHDEKDWFRDQVSLIEHLAAIGAGGQAVASLDDVAARLWKADAEDSGTPASVADGRTRGAFDDQAEEVKARWRKFAKAASSTLSQPHPADERVVEALRIADERLSSLLARIHRDGGHYEAAHGTEKAWADADEIISRIYADDTHPAHSPAALAQEGRS